jgi:hypothetical protein
MYQVPRLSVVLSSASIVYSFRWTWEPLDVTVSVEVHLTREVDICRKVCVEASEEWLSTGSLREIVWDSKGSSTVKQVGGSKSGCLEVINFGRPVRLSAWLLSTFKLFVSDEAPKALQSSLDCTELDPAGFTSAELLDTDRDTPPSLLFDIGVPDPSSIRICGTNSPCPATNPRFSLGTPLGRFSIAGGDWVLFIGRSDSEREEEEESCGSEGWPGGVGLARAGLETGMDCAEARGRPANPSSPFASKRAAADWYTKAALVVCFRTELVFLQQLPITKAAQLLTSFISVPCHHLFSSTYLLI